LIKTQPSDFASENIDSKGKVAELGGAAVSPQALVGPVQTRFWQRSVLQENNVRRSATAWPACHQVNNAHALAENRHSTLSPGPVWSDPAKSEEPSTPASSLANRFISQP
jgi:hypothetical protein